MKSTFLALCATLAALCFNPSTSNAQAVDPVQAAIAQATQKKLDELKAVKAELDKSNPAAAQQVTSCEHKLQESTTCTTSGCDVRPAFDYCGRALARAASQAPDYGPRLNNIASGIRGIKAQLNSIEHKVDVVDATTERTEGKVDDANRKLDDLSAGQKRLEDGLAEVNRTILKAQMNGLCNDEIQEIQKLQPAAQVIALQRLKTCVDQRPDLTQLGTSAIENGVGFVGTGDMIIVDPTQERSSGGWKKAMIIVGSTVAGGAIGAGTAGWAYPEITDAGAGYRKESAAFKGGLIGAGFGLVGGLVWAAATN